MDGQPYASGRWFVREGSEDEFIKRWKAFTQWSMDKRGARSFRLLRDIEEPRRFVSFGKWEDAAAMKEWRQDPTFADYLGQCRELCDEFEGRDYTLAASWGD